MAIKYLCNSHLKDKYLKAFIRISGTREWCDVCRKVKTCVDIPTLATRIEEDLRREYDDPWAAGFSRDDESGELIGGNIYDKYELVEREASIELYEIVEAICQEMDTTDWASRDWLLPESEYMEYGWQEFRRVVKHQMRFVFFSEKNHNLISNNDYNSLHPQDVLQTVGALLKSQNITTMHEPGMLSLYRARQHCPGDIVNTAAALGAPPVQYAQANRMSPAGIAMFYGAFDAATCLAEITDYDKRTSSVSYGIFTNQVPLRLIDFSLPLTSPSIFNPDYSRKAKRLREGAIFLTNFIRDLQQPIEKKDPHIEYVPTQVVCEYLRYMYKGGQIDGLAYNSVKNPGGKCVVLFIGNSESVDEVPAALASPATAYYPHVSDTPKLILKTNSVKRQSMRHLRTQRQAQIDHKRAQEQEFFDQLLSKATTLS